MYSWSIGLRRSACVRIRRQRMKALLKSGLKSWEYCVSLKRAFVFVCVIIVLCMCVGDWQSGRVCPYAFFQRTMFECILVHLFMCEGVSQYLLWVKPVTISEKHIPKEWISDKDNWQSAPFRILCRHIAGFQTRLVPSIFNAFILVRHVVQFIWYLRRTWKIRGLPHKIQIGREVTGMRYFQDI